MLFKLAFNLLTTIVNPDLLTDEKQGFSKIVQRSMIALALIVIIPTVFTYAMRLEGTLVSKENNIFMRLFMGQGSSDEAAGQTIAGTSLRVFITCADKEDEDCQTELEESLLVDVTNLSAMQERLNDKDNRDEYIYDYLWLFSFVVGGFIFVMLLIFSLDIAIRTVKLGFLQVIAPIAVVSYVDPKSSESGFFSKWLKVCINTYLMLFFRIAAVAFMVFIISFIPEIFQKIKDDDGNFFVVILIIIGILLFAKDVPKMLADLLGVEDVGFGTLGKALKGAALGATGLAFGATAAATGGLIGGVAGGIIGGKGGILSGIGTGIKTGIGGVSAAKGDVWKQAKGAIPFFSSVSAVGKDLKGDSFRWGPGAKFGAFTKRAQYESKLAREKKAYIKDFEEITAAGKAGYRFSNAEEASKILNKFGLDPNNLNPEELNKVRETLGKVEKERTKYSSKTFGDAFAAVEYSKARYRNLENRLEAAKATGLTADNSAEFQELLVKYGKARGTYEMAKEKFDKLKEVYAADAKKYEAFRAHEDRLKIEKSTDFKE